MLKTGVATKQRSFYYVSYYANFLFRSKAYLVYNASSWKAPVFSKRKYLSEADQS